jgi:hypothetical protein
MVKKMMMKKLRNNKKVLTMLVLGAMVIVGVAAVKPSHQNERNLKVLPNDISDQMLDSFMHSYNRALGVECNFCHAGFNGNKNNLDFASDGEPMKENARKMITMMIDINKRYFWYDTTKAPVYLNAVACYTCHRGQEMPPDNNKLPPPPDNKKPLFPFGGK